MKYIKLLKSILFMILSVNITKAIKCEQVDNQQCLVRETIVNTNDNEPRYYPYSIKLNKCTGSCDTLDNPFAKTCKPNKTAKKVVKMYDMLHNRHVPMRFKEDVSCKCECSLNSSVCSHKMQRWDKDKCRCKCKRRGCKKGYVWDYSVCSCINVYGLSNLDDLDNVCDNTKTNSANKINSSNIYYLIIFYFFYFFFI